MKKKHKAVIDKIVLRCLPIAVLPVLSPASAADSVDLFVMAGQSNMQGSMGNAECYPADPENFDQRIFFYWVTPGFSSSNGSWTHLQPQGGRFLKGHFGPEVTFARKLAKSGFTPAIFKYSLGSTGLARDWRAAGQKGMYDSMVVELRKAMALLEKNGQAVTVRAFVWIQGETDAETDEIAGKYLDNLNALIKDLRTNVLKDQQLPVILGVDEQHPWVKVRPLVVESQQRMTGSDPRAVFVSMIGLQKADSTHLTPAGLEAHGIRLFDAFEQITKHAQPGIPRAADKPRQ